MYLKSLSVSELNQYVKKILENDFILRNVLVEGEISNLKIHTSGHAYFSLKDSGGKINCVMFKSSLMYIAFEPKNGMKVTVKGRISLYEKEGKYQFYVNEMTEKGQGELFAKYIALKNRLESEGLFKESIKKSIPKVNKNVGVVTSGTGAALQDVISVIQRRNKGTNIYVSPCLVQGENAPKSIIKAVNRLEKIKEVDIIIITRGGGSLEELWAFNDEDLARCIFNCKKPVISAVGHETDFTISDFVSDLRAPTPSAAAELAAFDSSGYMSLLNELTMRLDSSFEKYMSLKQSRLELLREKLLKNSPESMLQKKMDDLLTKKKHLTSCMNSRIHIEQQNLSKQYALLNSYNPLNVLKKGYSIIQDKDGSTVRKREEIIEHEIYDITLAEDKVKARVIMEE